MQYAVSNNNSTLPDTQQYTTRSTGTCNPPCCWSTGRQHTLQFRIHCTFSDSKQFKPHQQALPVRQDMYSANRARDSKTRTMSHEHVQRLCKAYQLAMQPPCFPVPPLPCTPGYPYRHTLHQTAAAVVASLAAAQAPHSRCWSVSAVVTEFSASLLTLLLNRPLP